MNWIDQEVLENIRKRSKFMSLGQEYINMMNGVRIFFVVGTICLLSSWFMVVLGFLIAAMFGIGAGSVFYYWMVQRTKTWDFYLKEVIK